VKWSEFFRAGQIPLQWVVASGPFGAWLGLPGVVGSVFLSRMVLGGLFVLIWGECWVVRLHRGAVSRQPIGPFPASGGLEARCFSKVCGAVLSRRPLAIAEFKYVIMPSFGGEEPARNPRLVEVRRDLTAHFGPCISAAGGVGCELRALQLGVRQGGSSYRWTGAGG